jgi:hypothetical protein
LGVELTHQDIGQMDSYVRMFDDDTSRATTRLGLILTALNDSKQLFASKYMLYLPTEEELRRELERERRLIEERKHLEKESDQDSG